MQSPSRQTSEIALFLLSSVAGSGVWVFLHKGVRCRTSYGFVVLMLS